MQAIAPSAPGHLAEHRLVRARPVAQRSQGHPADRRSAAAPSTGSRAATAPGSEPGRLPWAAVPVALAGVASCRRRAPRVFARAAKRGGKRGGGGGASYNKKVQARAPREEELTEVSKGSAYEQETREIVLSLNSITKTALNGTPILKDVSLGMYLGAKIGILGANGAGKSTVMRILAGQDDSFLGELIRDDDVRVGFLEQEPELAEETVVDCLEPAIAPIRSKVAEFNEISVQMADPDCDMDALMERMGELQAEIDFVGGWEVEEKLDQAMESLRCPPRDAKIATLSGGEKRRVAICRLLLQNPDILLLDEPTNHLDAQSVEWLERYLAEFKGTVVAITHDRYFLDNVAGWILELDQGQGIPFEGNYSSWLESKAKRLANEKKRNKDLERQIGEELKFINGRRNGKQKKGAARMRRLDDLVDASKDYTRQAELESIIITPGPRLGDEVISAAGLSKGYGDRLLLDEAFFNIPPGAVVGIVGPNGAGKTTLFEMIMGRVKPDSGRIEIGKTVQPMYVDQSRDGLDGENTVLYELCGDNEFIDIGGREVMSRKYCSWFNFRGAKQNQTVNSLSGGERNRLQLAKTLCSGGNVLMLDEPSNDLDVDTLRALETAVENFAGTVLCVSHDRWFLDRIATHILAYEGDSKLTFFEGGYSEYEDDRRRRTGISGPVKTEYKPMPTFTQA